MGVKHMSLVLGYWKVRSYSKDGSETDFDEEWKVYADDRE